MFWYVLHTKSYANQRLLEAVNRFEDMQAFIPMVEKWFQCRGFKEYQLKELYPGYIFIKSPLDEETLHNKYKDFFQAIKGIGEVINQEHISAFNQQEEHSLSLLFNSKGVIVHSLGHYVDDELTVTSGPLQGFEKQIVKIDRHKRTALLSKVVLGQSILVPLEVKNTKGSIS